jgi:hypothetical protein
VIHDCPDSKMTYDRDGGARCVSVIERTSAPESHSEAGGMGGRNRPEEV